MTVGIEKTGTGCILGGVDRALSPVNEHKIALGKHDVP